VPWGRVYTRTAHVARCARTRDPGDNPEPRRQAGGEASSPAQYWRVKSTQARSFRIFGSNVPDNSGNSDNSWVRPWDRDGSLQGVQTV